MFDFAQKRKRNSMMFVQTFWYTYAIIIDVTPPIHYIVFATPHKNEIPSPKKASYPAGLFTVKKYSCFVERKGKNKNFCCVFPRELLQYNCMFKERESKV